MLIFLKYFFSTVFTLLIIICLAPFFIDKQIIVKEFQKFVNNNTNNYIDFDKDISLTFFPKPNMKVYNIIIKDRSNKLSSQIPELRIQTSWSSIFKWEFSIEKIRIIDPEVRLYNKYILANKNFKKILINSVESNLYNKLENLQNKVNFLEIINGKVFINVGKVSHVFSDINLNFNLKNNPLLKGEVYYQNYKVRNIINLESENKKKYNISWQKIFYDKSKLFTKGILALSNEKLVFVGNTNSEKLNLEPLFFVTNAIKNLWITNNIFHVNSIKKFDKLININVSVKKMYFKKYTLEQTNFNIEANDDFIKIKNLKSNFLNSKINSESIFDIKKKVFNGNISLRKLNLKEEFLGFTEYDIYGGEINCELKLNIKKIDRSKFYSIFSTGFFEANSIVFKGLDFVKVANKIDNVSNISDILKLGKKGLFKGNSHIQKINGQFKLQNNQLKIINIRSYHPNVNIVSNGDYELEEGSIELNNLINFRTHKYKNLPEFEIKIKGKPDSLNYSYDIRQVKDFFVSKGIENILKEKRIILEKESIKKFFDNGVQDFELEDLFKLF